jgi:LPS sulfotransferase NodH
LQYAAVGYFIAPLRSAYRLNLYLRYRPAPEPPHPTFILCTLRTGSNLLISYLNSVPGLSFAGEVLHPDQMAGLPRSGVSQDAVIQHIRYSLKRCGQDRCGVKLPADHLKWHGLDARQLHQRFPSSRLIVLYRRSLADQFLSLKLARATGRWVGFNAKTPSSDTKVHIDRDQFLKYAKQGKGFYSATINLNGVRTHAIVLSYEELVENVQGVFDEKLFPLLGMTSLPVATRMVKQNRKGPQHVVENYERVKDLWENPDFFQDYE